MNVVQNNRDKLSILAIRNYKKGCSNVSKLRKEREIVPFIRLDDSSLLSWHFNPSLLASDMKMVSETNEPDLFLLNQTR